MNREKYSAPGIVLVPPSHLSYCATNCDAPPTPIALSPSRPLQADDCQEGPLKRSINHLKLSANLQRNLSKISFFSSGPTSLARRLLLLDGERVQQHRPLRVLRALHRHQAGAPRESEQARRWRRRVLRASRQPGGERLLRRLEEAATGAQRERVLRTFEASCQLLSSGGRASDYKSLGGLWSDFIKNNFLDK